MQRFCGLGVQLLSCMISPSLVCPPSLPPLPSPSPPTISLIALTQFVYQTTFAPMIYWIFLNKFFKASSSAAKDSDTVNKDHSKEPNNYGSVPLGGRDYESQTSLLSSSKYKTSRMAQSPGHKSPQSSYSFPFSSSYGSMDDDSTTESTHAIQQI